MKKLMIGLAAAGLCGAVFADVTSANTVGYMNKESEVGGYTYVTPMFIQVDGEESIDLQDIQMAADVPPTGAYIDIRDDAEGYVKEFYWYQKVTAGSDIGKAGPAGFRFAVPEGKSGLWIEWVYTYIEPEFDPETYEIIDGDYLDFDHYDYPESGTDKQVNFASGEGFLLYLSDETYECFLNAPYEL